MIRKLHPFAGVIAFLTIFCFWTSTIAVELNGDEAQIAAVKRGILWALALLIPSIAIAGGTGFKLGGASSAPAVAAKRRRMPIVAMNGIVVLVPCAIVLQQRAAEGLFDRTFMIVQAIELAAGAVNLVLLGLNIRDGLKLTGRFGHCAATR